MPTVDSENFGLGGNFVLKSNFATETAEFDRRLYVINKNAIGKGKIQGCGAGTGTGAGGFLGGAVAAKEGRLRLYDK